MRIPFCYHSSRALATGEIEEKKGFASFIFRFHIWYCFLCWPYKRQISFINETFGQVWRKRAEKREIDAVKERMLNRILYGKN